eukprot:TRINITY_DN694_c0_g1_i5.p1 TRINITY_DN694_c0_g1~~TRINITY_DN694_c0_g1_i5.p1  ORF type:complete len:341 (+),score=65.08 TRINITY_DN694_c0_g1_i5:208-1230(+)
MQSLALLVTLVVALVIPSLQQGIGFRPFPTSSFSGPSLLSRDLFSQPVLPTFPSRKFPKTCAEAKANCAQKCGSGHMNFQCSDTHGIASSCACASTPGSGSGSSTTPRCLSAQAACETKCKGKDSFKCSDSGTSYSRSCSCISEDEHGVLVYEPVDFNDVTTDKLVDSHVDALTMNYKQFDTQQDEETVVVDPVVDPVIVVEPVVTQYNDEEEEQVQAQNLFFNFPSIKMDPFSNRNGIFSSSFASTNPFRNSDNFASFASNGNFGMGSSVGVDQEMGTDVCENAKKQCQLQCEGLEMDFDCKNEGGSYAKSCSCAGSTGDSAAFSSSKTLSSAAFENIM